MSSSVNFIYFLIFNTIILINADDYEIDENGYVAYCPCMGEYWWRF